MNNITRIFLIILCILMITIGAASIYFAATSVFAEEIENTETTFVNFNQYCIHPNNYTNSGGNTITNTELSTSHYFYIRYDINTTSGTDIYFTGASGVFKNIGAGHYTDSRIYISNDTIVWGLGIYSTATYTINNFIIIDISQMFGAEVASSITVEQCEHLFKADYYPYNTGTTIDLSGFEQYNAGVMNARESMTINTTSANIADNLSNVVINSEYGSNSKALIQGYMVWGSSDYTNCTALFDLETNFNANDYFEFEFYTITGADNANGLPNINIFYDLQIIAVDSSGNIVPLATVKAQNNPNTSTKSTFYLPFSTDKLYITTPHKYIIGYNNFKINITTTNLTALSLYSYKDGYKAGMSAGYTNGYNNGINGNNAAITSMDYIKSAFTTLGDILTIQVFPNVPLGTFFLLPLMASLIFFIVKVSKGG